MNCKNTIFSLFLFSCLTVSGQTKDYPDSIRRAIVDLYAQLLVFPQEKIYLQTDRPYYMNGEKIFFRAFLLHASTNKPLNQSRYIYAELISPVDTVVLRQKIRIDDEQMFYGALTLPETLPQGEYRIRAYTRYMENNGEACFYSRSVFIADPNAVKLELETDFEFLSDNEVSVGLRFRDIKTNNLRVPENINMKINKNDQKIIAKPNSDGWVYEKYKVKKDDKQRNLLIEYKDENNSFEEYIRIPYPENTVVDVSFYPEGGNLIAGQTNKIAFKVLLPDGNATEINGSIFNSKDELLTDFKTEHEGMGSFSFKVEAGNKYYAKFTYKDQTISVNLPEAKTNVCALQAIWENKHLSVSVLKPESLQNQKMYLLVHHHGVPTYFKEWDYSKEKAEFEKTNFQTGVSHLMLLNENFNPLSERLVFVNHDDGIKAEIQTAKKIYKQREHATFNIQLIENEKDTVPSTFLISVTDDKDVKIDTTTNIQAEILLASELNGQIKNPAWYFRSDEEKTKQAADLLMLTHGWRNYKVPEALQGNLQQPAIKPEVSQSFSGLLKGGNFFKPYKNGKIKMTALGNNFSEVATSDNEGRYRFDLFEFPDSTTYFFLSYTNEKTDKMDIYPDTILYPSVSISRDYDGKFEKKQKEPDFVEYVSKADLKYTNENGVRIMELPEVTIKGTQKKKEKRYENYISMEPDKSILPENIEEFPPSTWEELFWRIPGVSEVKDSRVIIRGNSAKFVLNGILLRGGYIDLCNNFNVNDVGQVDVFTEIAKTLYFGYDLGTVIALTTKPPGEVRPEEKSRNSLTRMPLGYQLPVAFYSPKYDTPEALNNKTPDLRSTIYWKPNVKADENGKTSIDFYTADTPSSYSVLIEGIGKNGKLIYHKEDAVIQVEK
jgi:hypothetical protein